LAAEISEQINRLRAYWCKKIDEAIPGEMSVIEISSLRYHAYMDALRTMSPIFQQTVISAIFDENSGSNIAICLRIFDRKSIAGCRQYVSKSAKLTVSRFGKRSLR